MRTPEGYVKLNVEVWTNGNRIVITGQPPDEESDDAGLHDCDYRGCRQNHVLYSTTLMAIECIELGYKSPPKAEPTGPSRGRLRAMERQAAAGNNRIYPMAKGE